MGWFNAIEHRRWLGNETAALLEFGRGAQTDTGFGYMDADGDVDLHQPLELYINCRMTHCYSLGTLLGLPGCRRYADHGVRTLRTRFKDPEFGGWFSAIEHAPDADGNGVPAGPAGERKSAYAAAFVLLAAASATAANRPGAHDLLMEALEDQELHWWDEEAGMVRESFNRDFTECEPYRGANAAMHTVEAYLAAADVTGDTVWLFRALRMADRVINVGARAHQWRIPEHYTETYEVDLEFNKDKPSDPFRPYGATIGHALEWARLLVHLRASLRVVGAEAPSWLLEAAEELFERARTDGWRVDGAPGFVYTTDFAGKPIVSQRMHWVACEGIAAAAAMRRALLDDGRDAGAVEHYTHCYRSWLDYVEEFVREAPGAWIHELSPRNEEATTTWGGKPDIYHALQATLMPRLSLAPSFATALASGMLDETEWCVQKGGDGKKRRWF
ncbi:AGE family epimerase/isomerase [Buchananella hordeovulneris]|uniref:AGE family epimerase/isomerase n=1 Tax=Buchananella hordeovulneris TaxID=52770 RepID=UPI000F5F1D65|nr:AGE family epimerase/isomerase [Buchananella hordeovulneris]RRD42862.1 N-acylglucosamine 2-epimerase [Buchananella hordeovulneris]